MTTNELWTRDCSIFNRMWPIAAVVAAIFAWPVVFLRDQAPWLIHVAIVVGVAMILFLEFKADGETLLSRLEWFYPGGPVTVIPPGYKGLPFYRRFLALFFRRSRVEQIQLDLFGSEFTTAAPRKKLILLKDERGQQIVLVEGDRFMARVTSTMIDDASKAAEYSILMAWQRFQNMAHNVKDLRTFFADKTVLESIKADFRGNISICIAKSGEEAVKFFLKEADDIQKVEALTLVESSKKSARGRHPSKSSVRAVSGDSPSKPQCD